MVYIASGNSSKQLLAFSVCDLKRLYGDSGNYLLVVVLHLWDYYALSLLRNSVIYYESI